MFVQERDGDRKGMNLNTFHLVDPALRPLLDFMPSRDFTAEGLDEARERMKQMVALAGVSAMAPRLVDIPRAGAPDVPLRLFEPEGEGLRPAILHMHGGGFVAGSAAMNDAQNSAYAATHHALVASVDYRLAPETAFPGPLDDCLAALEWIIAHADVLKINPAQIVVMGESAGGGLAAALALRARDLGIALAGQLLLYPMLDEPDGVSAMANPTTGEFIWTRGSNRFGWAAMRGDQEIAADCLGYFSPSQAIDVRGLAPACLLVGSLDLFLDETIAYAMRLSHAGVPVEFHVYRGCYHGFDLVRDAPPSQRLAADITKALTIMLG